MVEGLQDSIDGLQASISSEEEVLEGDESIYTSFTQELNDDSDDEIFPEETQADHVDYQVQDKVDKIHHTQVSFLSVFDQVFVLLPRQDTSPWRIFAQLTCNRCATLSYAGASRRNRP